MSDKVYSTNDEIFNHESIMEALSELHDDGFLELNGTARVWLGDRKKIDTYPSAGSLIDSMREDAYHQAGDSSDSYLDSVSSQQEAELQSGLNSLIDNWLVAHKLTPTFYSVENVEVLEVRITELSEFDFKFELIGPPSP